MNEGEKGYISGGFNECMLSNCFMHWIQNSDCNSFCDIFNLGLKHYRDLHQVLETKNERLLHVSKSMKHRCLNYIN